MIQRKEVISFSKSIYKGVAFLERPSSFKSKGNRSLPSAPLCWVPRTKAPLGAGVGGVGVDQELFQTLFKRKTTTILTSFSSLLESESEGEENQVALEAQYLVTTQHLGNAEPFEKRNLASVSQRKKKQDRFPLCRGGKMVFVFVLFLNGALRHQLLHLGLYLSLTIC